MNWATRTAKPWTRAMTAFARTMRRRGKSFGWIAGALGVGRAACVERLARIGALYRLPTALKPVEPQGDAPPALGGARQILGEGVCHWIEGELGGGTDWRMCGHPCVHGSSWCAHHHARVHRAAKASDEL